MQGTVTEKTIIKKRVRGIIDDPTRHLRAQKTNWPILGSRQSSVKSVEGQVMPS